MVDLQSHITVSADSIADMCIIAESLAVRACSTSETCNKFAAPCCLEMAAAFWACEILLDCHCGTVNARLPHRWLLKGSDTLLADADPTAVAASATAPAAAPAGAVSAGACFSCYPTNWASCNHFCHAFESGLFIWDRSSLAGRHHLGTGLW